MFDHLKQHRTIVVSGPQRSGTHIAARMIAADLGYEYVDDSVFGIHNRARWLWAQARDGVVIHCPGMARWVHRTLPDVGCVFMLRDCEDILRSEQRIQWDGKADVCDNYGVYHTDSAGIVYDFWERVQKPILKDRAHEQHYELLSTHPLWVAKDKRPDWQWDCTSLSEPPTTLPPNWYMASGYPDPYVRLDTWIRQTTNPQHHGFVRLLLWILEQLPESPRRILDVGYGWGTSTSLWLTMLPECEVVTVDPLEIGEYAGYAATKGLPPTCLDRWYFRKTKLEDITRHEDEYGEVNWLITDEAIVCSSDGDYFDFIYLDADHLYESTKAQIDVCWDLLAPGGTLAGHDFYSARDGVGRAVIEFSVAHNLTVKVTDIDAGAWVIRKADNGN